MSKKYYVSLAFADDAGRTRSITLSTPVKAVTAPLIREALRELELGENSALLSVSWLGKMSEKQYVNGVTPITVMNEATFIAAMGHRTCIYRVSYLSGCNTVIA